MLTALFFLSVSWPNYHVNPAQEGHLRSPKSLPSVTLARRARGEGRKGSKSRSVVVRARLSYTATHCLGASSRSILLSFQAGKCVFEEAAFRKSKRCHSACINCDPFSYSRLETSPFFFFFFFWRAWKAKQLKERLKAEMCSCSCHFLLSALVSLMKKTALCNERRKKKKKRSELKSVLWENKSNFIGILFGPVCRHSGHTLTPENARVPSFSSKCSVEWRRGQVKFSNH